MRLKFKLALGECASKEWISQEIQGPRFRYFLMLQLVDLHEVDSDFIKDGGPRFYSNLTVIAPELADPERLRDAYRSMGILEDLPTAGDEHKACVLFEYGYRGEVWQTTLNDPMMLMKEAVERAHLIVDDLEPHLYRQVNRMGDTVEQVLYGQTYFDRQRKLRAA